MFYRSFFFSLLLGALALSVQAQRVLTLQEVIADGLENNYAIRMARNAQQIAVNNYTPGNAGYLPSIDLRSQVAVNRNNIDRTATDGSVDSTRGLHSSVASLNLNLGWTLFDGFRVQTTYDKLGDLKEMGEINTRRVIEQMIANIAAEYYNLVRQQQQLENLKFAVSLSRERMRIDEERFLLGSGSRLQLLQAEVFLNADSARMTRQEEVVRASQVRLKELMARKDLRTGFSAADAQIPLNDLLIFESLQSSIRANNTALLIAEKDKSVAAYDVKLASSAAYPYVRFNSAYGYTHNTYGSGAYSDQQTFGMNYGITVGLNIYDGFNQRRRVSNATIQAENSRLRFEDIEHSLMADFVVTYNEYLNFFRLIEMESHNLQVAYETLNIALERYRLGALSGLELREVQKSLLEAEERLLTVEYQAKRAEIVLMLLAGRVSEYV